MGRNPSADVSVFSVLLGPHAQAWSWLAPHVTLSTEPYSYDFPEDVASALGTSFNNLLGTINPTQKRTGEFRRRGLEGAGERQGTQVLGG